MNLFKLLLCFVMLLLLLGKQKCIEPAITSMTMHSGDRIEFPFLPLYYAARHRIHILAKTHVHPARNSAHTVHNNSHGKSRYPTHTRSTHSLTSVLNTCGQRCVQFVRTSAYTRSIMDLHVIRVCVDWIALVSAKECLR